MARRLCTTWWWPKDPLLPTAEHFLEQFLLLDYGTSCCLLWQIGTQATACQVLTLPRCDLGHQQCQHQALEAFRPPLLRVCQTCHTMLLCQPKEPP